MLRFTTITVGHATQRSHPLGFIARCYDTTTTCTDAQALEALERVVAAAAIQAAAAVPTQRRRKLPTAVTLRLCIGMSLCTAQALDVVRATMTHGLRLFWPAPAPALATKGALAQARPHGRGRRHRRPRPHAPALCPRWRAHPRRP